MTKIETIQDPKSCWNKAKSDEHLFILLGRDKAAVWAVREWIRRRIALGLNKPDDPQIRSAWDWIIMVDDTPDDSEEEKCDGPEGVTRI